MNILFGISVICIGFITFFMFCIVGLLILYMIGAIWGKIIFKIRELFLYKVCHKRANFEIKKEAKKDDNGFSICHGMSPVMWNK